MGRSRIAAGYLRNFIFGVEDSLVSTVGLISGIAISGMNRQAIFLTGMVLIFVEAFSMAVGSFLSEHSAEDYLEHAETPIARPYRDSFIMFFSYFLSGFIPLLPYILFSVAGAFWVSIAASLAALFALGVIGAVISGTKILRNGLRMFIIGGIAILVGVVVGSLVNSFQALS